MAPLSTSDNIQPVRAAHSFDETALLRYLQSAVSGFPQHSETRLQVGQFGHGQSNPTFLLEVQAPTGEGGRFVLRKKPPGKLLKSAHAVDREYQVLKALNGTAVPVPKVICLCTDPSIIGTAFYVMEHIEGRIFLDPALPEVTPPVRHIMYEDMARTLAAIHAVDVDQVGLSGFGRRDNYCKRQVDRWAAQYAASVNFPGAEPDPKMLSLIDWLRAHVPEEDAGASGPIKGLVHGDYRLDNLVFHPTEPRIIAVLDWELSTLGNQRSDLAYSCLPHIFPTKYRQLYALPKPLPRGVPTQAEFVQLYSTALGFPAPSSDQFIFYTAVSLFRAAAIFAGVYRRALQGNASSEHASKTGVLVEALAGIALDVTGAENRGTSGRSEGRSGDRELSHAQQKYVPGGLPGVPTGHFGSKQEGIGEASHAQQKYAPGTAQSSFSQMDGSEAGLTHAQQKYAPGGLPGVPTGHFGSKQEEVRGASHAQQKYAPVSNKTPSTPANRSDVGLSHAQQKYAPGGLPGVPTGHFGSEPEGVGEATHAQQKYAPISIQTTPTAADGSEADLSHAQQKYAPGGLPGVPTGHFGKERGGDGVASHAQQRYAPDSPQSSPSQSNGSAGEGAGLSHAQQKYAPGGLPGVPTGHFGKREGGDGVSSHAQQKYAPESPQSSPSQNNESAGEAAGLTHAQQKYAPGGLPGVPTGHFGKQQEGEASHAQQKYAPSSGRDDFETRGTGAESAAISHAQQKYSPGALPGVPTGHFGIEQEGVGEASHAQQKYGPVSGRAKGGEARGDAISHAQQKYAPGGLPGVPTGHLGKEGEGGGVSSHAQQKYALTSSRNGSFGAKGGEAEGAALSHAQQKYAPGGLPGVPTGHFGMEQDVVGDASHAQQRYAPVSGRDETSQARRAKAEGAALSHAQQKYAPGGLPGVPTGHFDKEQDRVGEASHAQQKYAPVSGPENQPQERGTETGGLTHAQQKYAPGGLPGVPTGHFGSKQEGIGEASHAQQKYSPDCDGENCSSRGSGSGSDAGLSHAQQKYAPGGLSGVSTGHFGREQQAVREATHGQQKYAPGTAPGTTGQQTSWEGTPGLSHAQQKYAPGGLPGVPTGRFEGSRGVESQSHASQRYSPSGLQRVSMSSNGDGAGGCHCKGGCGKATLGFAPSEKAEALRQKLEAFLAEHIYPVEPILDKHSKSDVRWTIHPLQEQLKEKARAQGLWNLWVPKESGDSIARTLGLPRDSLLCGAGLTNLEYAHCCEVMGKSVWAPEVFNCSAPDTGNMEVLARYGTPDQQKQWLLPLLDGRIRSCFAMTEPDVASSDATNIESRIAKHSGGTGTGSGNGHYVLDGKKWWTSGAMDPRCQLAIFMGKTNPGLSKHRQQSMILVDMRSEGVKVVRPLTVFGFEDAPHGHAEVHFDGVKVPAGNLLLGEGRGFEIAQGRLGPGRLHHCMRLIGAAERGIELMVSRSRARTTFGKKLSEHGGLKAEIAQCRIEIEQARLLVLNAAHQLDLHGNKEARVAIAIAKVVAPNAALKVLDRAIQVHGGAGVCSDFPLSHLWAAARTLRIADGPDEVHLETIGRAELARARL